MMIVLSTIAMGGIAACFVTYRLLSNQDRDSGFDSLHPLGRNTLDVLQRIKVSPRWGGGEMGKVSLREIVRVVINFRILARKADTARLLSDEREEAFAMAHACLAENARDMAVRASFAVLEKVVNYLSGTTSQVYAYATLASYSEEVDLLQDILELAGDDEARELLENIT